jgi:RecB family exonuclease
LFHRILVQVTYPVNLETEPNLFGVAPSAYNAHEPMAKSRKSKAAQSLVGRRWRRHEAHNAQSKRARDYWAQFTSEERSAILRARAKIRDERRKATAMLGRPKAEPKGKRGGS